MLDARSKTDDPYLIADSDALAQAKTRTYELMRLEEGQHVLDVGCGHGMDTVALSRHVGARGRVVGIDCDPAMVDEADRNSARAGVQEYVQHYRSDAGSLPFVSGSFAACRCERVFRHLDEPELALREMVRVTRRKGWIVVVDEDWGSLSLDTNENSIERRLVRFAAEHCHPNGFAGRQLYRLFRAAGLMNVHIETFVIHSTRMGAFPLASLTGIGRAARVAGAVTEQELTIFYEDVQANEKNGTVFGSINLVLVAGCVQ